MMFLKSYFFFVREEEYKNFPPIQQSRSTGLLEQRENFDDHRLNGAPNISRNFRYESFIMKPHRHISN